MMSSFEMENSENSKKGMGWPKASLFLIGHSAGAGMLAMPVAFSVLGLEIGTILALICVGFSLNTGLQLGWMWQILQEIWPEYKKTCQNPYGEIAFRSFGRTARILTEVMVCFAQLGYTVILLLLAARNASVLVHFFFNININQCYLILIVSVFVWPTTMLKSPKDFWQIAWISTASSWIAVILIVIGVIRDSPVCSEDVPHDSSISLLNSFMSYGSIVFAYAAHPSFPTCQHDMKKPSDFWKSLILTWTVISFYYLTVSYLGYFVYGSSLGDSIISSIQNSLLKQLINLMFAIHVASTIIVAASPAFQQFEQILKVPFHFSWKRFVLRSVLFFGVTFTALTFPHFGPMVNLLGASVSSLVAMILPSAFYLSLRTFHLLWKKEKLNSFPTLKQIYDCTPTPLLLFNLASMTFGLVTAILATISAIRTFADSSLPPPCYHQYLQSGLPFSSDTGNVDCCGSGRNLTVSGVDPNGFCFSHDMQ